MAQIRHIRKTIVSQVHIAAAMARRPLPAPRAVASADLLSLIAVVAAMAVLGGAVLAEQERAAERTHAELAECRQDLEVERAIGRVGLNLLADCTGLLGEPAIVSTCMDGEPVSVSQ